MRLLITGGAGFIGSNLCRRACADPSVDSVTVLDNLATGARANLDGVGVKLIEGSILDGDALAEAMLDAETVVHLAALPSVPRSIADPLATHDANATGTLRVLEAARRHGIGHVVLASSSSVYGANPVVPKAEEAWTSPLSPYAASKLAAESYGLAYQTTYGLSTLVFRFFNVYGPGQAADHPYAAVVPLFLAAGLAHRPVVIHGDGLQSRDFTYVGSVAAALLRAASERISCERPVNLAFGGRITLLELVDTISQVLGYRVEVVHRDPRPSDVRHSQADCARLLALMPALTPTRLADGLAQTALWLQPRLPRQSQSPQRAPLVP